MRRILSIKNSPPAVRKLSKSTPRNHTSTNHTIPVGCAASVPAAGAPDRSPRAAICTGITALAEVFCAPYLTAESDCRSIPVKVITGAVIINTSVTAASA